MEKPGLELGYSGDEAWNRLVNAYLERCKGENVYPLSKLLDNHEDIAIVICGFFGTESGLRWIKEKIPVLEYLRPIDCLDNEILLKRLKTALMQIR